MRILLIVDVSERPTASYTITRIIKLFVGTFGASHGYVSDPVKLLAVSFQTVPPSEE